MDDYAEQALLCREDFDELIEEIRSVGLSHNYAGLMYWLICRGFMAGRAGCHPKTATKLNRNRPVLLKVLYAVNPEAFLMCFKQS